MYFLWILAICDLSNSYFSQNIKRRWFNTDVSLLKSFSMVYVVLIGITHCLNVPPQNTPCPKLIWDISVLFLYISQVIRKKKKQKKHRTGKHISYFNTVQPTLLWSSINPKYFSVISSHLLIPKFRLHSTPLYYFNSILTRRVTLLKSMPRTETETSPTQNSSVVLHHSLDNPSVFPIIHRVGHKSLFMAVNGIFVLVLVSETWSLYGYEASSVFAPSSRYKCR